MMASTARIAALSFQESGGQTGRSASRGQCTWRLRKIEIGATAHAHLIRDRHDVPAVGALPERIVLFVAVQDGRDDPHPRQRGAHEEPDEEGTPLHAADHAGRDAEHDGNEDERQSTRSAQMTAITATTATTIHRIAATALMTNFRSTNAATTRTATASSLRAASEASCPMPQL